MPTTATGMGEFTTVFDALTTGELTSLYTGNQAVLNTHGAETATVLIDHTIGTETSVDVRVELWDAEEGWFVVPYTYSTMASEYNSTASSTKRWNIRRIGRFETQIRISAKVSGSASAATALTVKVQLGGSRYPIAGNYQ